MSGKLSADYGIDAPYAPILMALGGASLLALAVTRLMDGDERHVGRVELDPIRHAFDDRVLSRQLPFADARARSGGIADHGSPIARGSFLVCSRSMGGNAGGGRDQAVGSRPRKLGRQARWRRSRVPPRFRVIPLTRRDGDGQLAVRTSSRNQIVLSRQ